jgi:hypothetical protein
MDPDNLRNLTHERVKARTEVELAAQFQVRAIAADLEALRFRLWGVHASLPITAQEPAMLAGEAEMDLSTEVRSIIECVLNDDIEPAIRDLVTAATYVQIEEEEAG